MRHGCASGSDGYLLLEALAALAIGAVILVGLASTVHVVLVASDRAASQVQTGETLDRSVDGVDRELRLVSGAQWGGASGKPNFAFAGGPDTILFTRDVTQANGLRAAVAVTFQATKAGSDAVLLRAEAPLPPGSLGISDVAFGRSEVVYRGPLAVSFAYLARTTDGGLGPPSAAWTDTADLPAAVQVTWLDPRNAIPAVSRISPLRITGDAGCLLPQVFTCRGRSTTSLDAAAGADAPRSGQ